MENLVNDKLFGGVYAGRRVLITGASGFKGSWLALWLHQMGAEVCGLSLDTPSQPAHFDLLQLPGRWLRADIRQPEALQRAFDDFRPEIVFHLAAQALVLEGYARPADTFLTNTQGTANVLEAVRQCPSVRVIVSITTDKVYQNHEWLWGYRENDPLGGHDPYSASKAACELVCAAYRSSFFDTAPTPVLLATARAGNVVGGGDWGAYRLVPDMVRAWHQGQSLHLRHPDAVRPWQHVLEPLAGYLLLAQGLWQGKQAWARAWNFGPDAAACLPVRQVVEAARQHLPQISIELAPASLHESAFLRLDSAAATQTLGWRPVASFDEHMALTFDWYKAYYLNNEIISAAQLKQFVQWASAQKQVWTQP